MSSQGNILTDYATDLWFVIPLVDCSWTSIPEACCHSPGMACSTQWWYGSWHLCFGLGVVGGVAVSRSFEHHDVWEIVIGGSVKWNSELMFKHVFWICLHMSKAFIYRFCQLLSYGFHGVFTPATGKTDAFLLRGLRRFWHSESWVQKSSAAFRDLASDAVNW